MCLKKVDLTNFSFNFQCEVCESTNVLVGLGSTPSLKSPVLILKCKNCDNSFDSIISKIDNIRAIES